REMRVLRGTRRSAARRAGKVARARAPSPSLTAARAWHRLESGRADPTAMPAALTGAETTAGTRAASPGTTAVVAAAATPNSPPPPRPPRRPSLTTVGAPTAVPAARRRPRPRTPT